ncbi:DNA-binding protein YbiB [Cupriavidus sp. AU9028]|uniref:DNA-binding protein YbiB n=1 Tax=Cupriavidus sp. AU9028 TaxID=2871157 RepID=UPI001C987B1C|nr:DNA-binding protein YbiB [Cupriavidus sp. AU9028]MBY4896547.1 DNA-binding protein YbiB [Cupriavidus sp. AU9028]
MPATDSPSDDRGSRHPRTHAPGPAQSVAPPAGHAAPPGQDRFPTARFIKEIGRGVQGARALPRDDARTLFDAMLAGRVPDLELGAVLMAYRIKGEAPHELAGMLEAAYLHCAKIDAPAERQAVVIPSYNGARKQPNLVPLLALLLAREGVPVLVHGTRVFNDRVTSLMLFEALGIAACGSAAEASQRLAQPAHFEARPGLRSGPLAVLPIDVLSPALTALLDKRTMIGLRNSSHTIVKLLQPIGNHTPAEALRLYSYTHPEYRETLTDFFSHEPANVLLARGTEGEVVADARRGSRIDWLHDGHQRTLVDPTSGSIGEPPALPPGTDVRQCADWIAGVLSGDIPVPAPIAAQVDAIHTCLANGARVTWASPL